MMIARSSRERREPGVDEFSNLPPLAQAKRYRALAQDARREAAAVTGPTRKSYLIIAENWDKLAANAEAAARKPAEK
jgi:hypothetical protein